MNSNILNIRKNFAIYAIFIAFVFHILSLALKVVSLTFRLYIVNFVYCIVLVLIIIGIVQFIFKIRSKFYKFVAIIISSFCICYVLLIASMYFLIETEHVVYKSDLKLVARVNGFLHTSVKYYDYKNYFIMGKNIRLYEDYGNGDFDPIIDDGREVKSFTWYDDDGNEVTSTNAKESFGNK